MNWHRTYSMAALCATLGGCGDVASPAAPTVDLIAGPLVFDGPSVLAPGDSFPVRVTSYSAPSFGSTWSVRIYLSKNDVISDEDTPVLDLALAPDENGGTYSRASATGWARVPGNLGAGIYTLGGIINPDRRIPETSHENDVSGSALRLGIGVGGSDIAAPPQQMQPMDRDSLQGTSTFGWTRLAGAVLYSVEVDQCSRWTTAWWADCDWYPWLQWITDQDTLTLGLPPQPGRWRVRALDNRYLAGPASAWRTFRSY